MTTLEAFIRERNMQHEKIPDETKMLIPCKNKVKAWAAQNAYTLIFFSLMFFITWVLFILSGSGLLP